MSIDAEEIVAAPKEAELQPVTKGPTESFYERHMEWILGSAAVLGFLSFWEWLGTSGVVNPLFTSAPTKVVAAFFRMLNDGTLLNDLVVSGQEFAIGYGLALAVGVPVGVIIGWYRPANAALNPFVTSLYATPRTAMMPLMIIWLGIGIWSKVAIVFLGSVFPMLINMQTAMRTLDPDLLKAARSFGASDWDIFKTIALPTSVPFLISGLRLALGHGLVGIVVGEMFAATAGLGYRMTIAGSTFRTDEVFVIVFILVLAGLGLNSAFVAVERRFSVWRPTQH